MTITKNDTLYQVNQRELDCLRGEHEATKNPGIFEDATIHLERMKEGRRYTLPVCICVHCACLFTEKI